MAARSYAGPVSGDPGDPFPGPSIVEVGAGYRCPRGTTDAPRDGEGETRATPMVLAL